MIETIQDRPTALWPTGRKASIDHALNRRLAKLTRDQERAFWAVQDSGWSPIGDHYFVVPLPPEERYGVLHLPVKQDGLIGATTMLDNEATGLRRGLVVAVGPGAWLPGRKAFIEPSVGLAEIVLYDRFRGDGASILTRAGLTDGLQGNGVSTLLGGVEITVLAECNIQGVVDPE